MASIPIVGAITIITTVYFQDETQQMCLDNFLIYAKSDNVAIRIKAGRCLGIFLEFDDVAQADGLFLLHAFDIIERNFDIKDLECGAVYSWGFGNFTGVLATHYQGVLINVGGPEDFLPRLRALVQKCMQSPKVFSFHFELYGLTLILNLNLAWKL